MNVSSEGKPDPGQVMSDARHAARRAIAICQLSVDVPGAVPTVERLLKSPGSATVQARQIRVDLSSAGGSKSQTVTTARVRMGLGPFETLATRGLLHADSRVNGALTLAGRKFVELWEQAGLSPVRAQNPENLGCTAPSAGLFGTERAADAFKAYCQAKEALMGVDALAWRPQYVVEAVVVEERPLVDVGRRVSGIKAEKTASAFAVQELVRGLERLAIWFGFLTVSDLLPPPAVLHDEAV